MLKILFLSFYYEPDLSAGSFRSTALVNHLSRHSVDLDVVTTEPNRYSSFKPSAPSFSHEKNIKIFRIRIPNKQNGMVAQIITFSSYYRSALKLVKKNEYDMVFATSSKLFTAFLGARIARKKRLPLYLDIRDIFLDTVCDILPSKFIWPVSKVLSLFERYTFKSANHINLVSKGFAPYFKKSYPNLSLSFYTNGIDKEFLNSPLVSHSTPRKNTIVNVVYAGNIGEGQGLELILPELAKMLNGQAKFRIIGDGNKRKKLESVLRKFSLNNVEVVDPVAREKIITEYINSDILFLHLNNHDAFKKVLPSKLFEYAATGKPIWAGLNGYSADFAISEISNCEIFMPGDVIDAIKKFSSISIKVEQRFNFKNKFSRERIMREMALNVISVAKRET